MNKNVENHQNEKTNLTASERNRMRIVRNKKRIDRYTIMDDAFMRNVFKKKECTEFVLRVIMKKKDLFIKEQFIQKDYKNLQGRSAILDCVACDADSNIYNIEIQQEKEGASPKRARYHSGLMDTEFLKTGQGFNELPESYVIFITKEDTLKSGLPIYHINRKIEETKEDFKDGSHILYVNSSMEEDTELGRLMHDMNCARADEMYSSVLADRMRELKETQEGVEIMSSVSEEIYNEGLEDGKEIGEMKAKKEVAVSLFKMGTSYEQIAKALRVEVCDVQKWVEEELELVKC